MIFSHKWLFGQKIKIRVKLFFLINIIHFLAMFTLYWTFFVHSLDSVALLYFELIDLILDNIFCHYW
jgi:hypothetical protein